MQAPACACGVGPAVSRASARNRLACAGCASRTATPITLQLYSHCTTATEQADEGRDSLHAHEHDAEDRRLAAAAAFTDAQRAALCGLRERLLVNLGRLQRRREAITAELQARALSVRFCWLDKQCRHVLWLWLWRHLHSSTFCLPPAAA